MGNMGTVGMIIYIVVIVAFFYFVMIRPQKKRQKKEEEMRNNVQVGDEIITISGVYGRIVAIKEDSFIIASGPDNAKQKIARWAIQQNLTVHED
jgi:preprotein translocase subunit YajC